MVADSRHQLTHSRRRQFIQAALSSAAVGIATQLGIEVASSEQLNADPVLSPDRAVQELQAGNQRFATNQLASITHDLAVLKSHTVDKQEPFAAVLACADSRVPVELVFDQTIGHIFVTRVAGNIATPEIIASLEYGVAILGVKAIVVLGHSNCGAVKAAMTIAAVPGQISALYPYLRGAVERSNGDFSRAIEANTKIQTEALLTSSPIIRDAVTAGKLKVVPGVYDLATGKVHLTLTNR
jgi:carbonic anhydrase